MNGDCSSKSAVFLTEKTQSIKRKTMINLEQVKEEKETQESDIDINDSFIDQMPNKLAQS